MSNFYLMYVLFAARWRYNRSITAYNNMMSLCDMMMLLLCWLLIYLPLTLLVLVDFLKIGDRVRMEVDYSTGGAFDGVAGGSLLRKYYSCIVLH